LIFPPPTPQPNPTNPPQHLFQQLAFTTQFTHHTYTFSNIQLPSLTFILHFTFSILIPIIYSILVKKYPYLAIAQAALFGI
ncbi:DUF1440 domain-containing protein, partial [Staphylococcus aureus]|uniref:DUF1440 domain-containing protein n=1 Tax=Staphylococcus aureus TaxID=1280 RepID=UPI0016426183